MSSEWKEQGAAHGCAAALLHSLKAGSRIGTCWKWALGHAVFWILPVWKNSLGAAQTWPETMLASVRVGLSFCAQECSLAEFILLIQLWASVLPALSFGSLVLKEAEVLSKVPDTQDRLPLAHLIQGMQIMDWDSNYVQNKWPRDMWDYG